MGAADTTQLRHEDLDTLAQQPTLYKLYTQICFCYPLANTISHESVISTLTKGLERLTESFPWVAGQVVNEAEAESPPIFKIRPFERIPRLNVRDYRDDSSIPTMEALRKANFPFYMLDESIIAPRMTMAAMADAPTDPAEVFIVQANFLKGGLLLTINGQHNVMDGLGQGMLMELFSKACRNEPFTEEECSAGNLDRTKLVPLLDESYTPGSELKYQIAKPPSSSSALAAAKGGVQNSRSEVEASFSHETSFQEAFPNHPDGSTEVAICKAEAPPAPANCIWAYFDFSPSSLVDLKALASKTVSSGYITTDDALTALIWQATMRARQPRYVPTVEATIARAVDVRRFMGVSSRYTGYLQNMTYHTYELQKLLDEPLGGLASNLRAPLDPKTSKLAYYTQALATVLARSADKSTINVTATLDLPRDIMLSSWAKLNCYSLDFNLGLGRPECVRRPRLIPVESLMYLMPKALSGGIAAGLCLRDEDMEKLKADRDFMKYGKFIG
ncbi:transferase family-domain-containing protein [Xylariales sp. AK1849]|nr:transferase family-domain-containing protein [Xylariales sp. AK1849]